MTRTLGFVLATVLITTTAGAATTIVVVPTQGNPVQSGNDLLAAVAGITNNNWSNRYVVKLDPGVFELGNQTLQMKQYVDIAGSGVESTLLYGNGNLAATGLFRGIVQGTDNAELRDLTVQVFPVTGRQILVGMYNANTSPRVTNVQFRAYSSTTYCGGIFAIGSSSLLDNVNVRVACAGDAEGMSFDLGLGRPTITRADIIAQNTTSSGTAYGIALYQGGAPSEVRDSKVVALGGSIAAGLGLPTTTQVLTTTVTGSTISGQSAPNSYGVYSLGLLGLVLRHSRVAATSGTSNYGVYDSGNSLIDLENCTVSAVTNTLLGSNIRVGDSKLQGGAVSGSVVCAGTYDENFTFNASTCP